MISDITTRLWRSTCAEGKRKNYCSTCRSMIGRRIREYRKRSAQIRQSTIFCPHIAEKNYQDFYLGGYLYWMWSLGKIWRYQVSIWWRFLPTYTKTPFTHAWKSGNMRRSRSALLISCLKKEKISWLYPATIPAKRRRY